MEKLTKIDEVDVDKLLWRDDSPYEVQAEQLMPNNDTLPDDYSTMSLDEDDDDVQKFLPSPTFAEKCRSKVLFGRSHDKNSNIKHYHEAMVRGQSPPISEAFETQSRMTLRSATTYAKAVSTEKMPHNVAALLNATSIGIRAPAPYLAVMPGAKMESRNSSGQPILVDVPLPVPPNITHIRQLYATTIQNDDFSEMTPSHEIIEGFFSRSPKSIGPVVSLDTQISEDYYRKVRESRFIDWENTTWVTYKEGEVVGSKCRSFKPKSRLTAFAKEYYPDGVPLETIAYYKELNERRKNTVGGKLDMNGFEEKLKGQFQQNEPKDRSSKSPVFSNNDLFSSGRGLDLSSRGGGVGRMRDSIWGTSSPVASSCTVLPGESRFAGVGSTSPDLFNTRSCNLFDEETDASVFDFDEERNDPSYTENSHALPKLPKNRTSKPPASRARGRPRT